MNAKVNYRPNPRPNLRNLMSEKGDLSDEKVLWHIRRLVFPLRLRVADTLRLLITGDSHTAEWNLIRDLAGCASTEAIGAAFSDYRHSPFRMPKPLRLILGQPCQKRAEAVLEPLKNRIPS